MELDGDDGQGERPEGDQRADDQRKRQSSAVTSGNVAYLKEKCESNIEMRLRIL